MTTKLYVEAEHVHMSSQGMDSYCVLYDASDVDAARAADKAKIAELQERLARSEAALRRIAAGGLFQPESFIKVAAEALAAADGKQQDCEHRSTHPGMPKDQPCHYCDGTATVAIQQDGGEA